MQEIKQTYSNWRKILLRTNMFLALLAFIVEVLMFFVLNRMNLIFQPIFDYFKWFLLIPAIANSIIIFLGQLLMKYVDSESPYVNYIPIVQLALICTVLASIHNIFSVTLCFFCFPLFMTAIFGDKKMVRNMAFISSLLLAVALLYRKFGMYSPANDIYYYAEAVVSYVVLFATYIACDVLIKFQEEKTHIINKGYQQHIKMQDQLNRDQKTGLYGQTIFANTLSQMIEMLKKGENTVSLAIMDIDDFKRINDTYGHLKGDQIILILADIMKNVFHNNHMIYRIGGEEFAVIFLDCKLNHAYSYLEECRNTFERQKYSFMKDTVTISIGIAQYQPGWTAEQLFEAADAAMYSSKNSGKNKTILYA